MTVGLETGVLVAQSSHWSVTGQEPRLVVSQDNQSEAKLGNINLSKFLTIIYSEDPSGFHYNQTPFSGECRPWTLTVIIYFGKYFVVCYEIFLLGSQL